MQKSAISLETGLYQVKKTADFFGFKIPDEVLGYKEDFQLAETQGGIFDLSHWTTLKVAGKDAEDFLQRMTSVNFKTLNQDTVCHGAFLTGKGGVAVLGMFHREEKGFDLIVTPNQTVGALEHIEKFHFGEDFVAEDKSSEWALFGWWNPRAELLEDFHIPANWAPLHMEWRRWKSLNMHIWRDNRRAQLFWIKISRKEAAPLLFELNRLGVSLLGQKLFDYYRVQHGVPALGFEITEKDIILETGFDEAVSRNKGCYPGQEVVERIFTYGSVNRKLMKVEIEEIKSFPSLPLPIVSEKPVGILVSVVLNPLNEKKGVGLAFINKHYWDWKESFALAEFSLRLKQ